MTSNGANGTNGHRPLLTRRETRKIWEAYGRPEDARSLAQHLWAIGYPIPVKTLTRWIARWQELIAKPEGTRPPADPRPKTLEAAIERLDEEVPTVTNDPLVRSRELLNWLEGNARKDEIDAMTDAQLTRALARKTQQTCLRLCEKIDVMGDYLVRERTRELGVLMKYLGEAASQARIGYEKAIYLDEKLSGTDAKVIDHDPQEPHPMARALTHWGNA